MRMAVKVVTCIVCSKNEDVKYKCPSCRAAYCSVACCREHKLACSSNKADAESLEPARADVLPVNGVQHRTKCSYETDDTVSLEQLERLRASRKLKEMLENPHLRQMMGAIDGARDAADLIGLAMKEPIFTEMADECLRIIGGERDPESEDEFS